MAQKCNALYCTVCFKDGPHKCGRCAGVRYCSKEHQKFDWPLHKTLCNDIKEQWAALLVDSPSAKKDERKNKLETLLWRNMLKKDDSGYSHYMLARCLIGDSATSKELAEAEQLLEIASMVKKSANAQYVFGGFSEVKDMKKAMHLFKLAAAQKHIDAMARIAEIYSLGHPGTIDVDHVEALKYGIPAAEAGSHVARVRMGCSLKLGLAGVVDIPKATRYLRAAAEEDEEDVTALLMLGKCYEEGPEKDDDQAKMWIKRAREYTSRPDVLHSMLSNLRSEAERKGLKTDFVDQFYNTEYAREILGEDAKRQKKAERCLLHQ